MQQKTQQILSWTLLAALVLWGGYTFFYYLGMPVHRASLLTEASNTWVNAQCSAIVCQGVYAFFPLLSLLFTRAEPFLWYGIISVVLFGIFGFVQWMRHGSLRIRLHVKPWYFAAGFVFFLWLLFTVFTAYEIDGFPMKRLVEPSPQVYRDVSEGTLAALRENFVMLESRGCLTQVGEAAAGVGIYDMKGLCIQEFFMERVLSQLLVIAGFLFLLLIAGHTLLGFLRVRMPSLFAEGLLSIGLGAGVWIAALWLLAIIGAYTPNVGWALIIAIAVLCYKSAWDWIKAFTTHEWEVEVRLYDPILLVGFLLLSYIALNFLVVVRPFPIGWDDLGSYINRPRLLVSYGKLIPSMATFQWEYLTSLGFLLFGYTSYFGATAAMLINWSQGLLALCTVWLFGRTFFGARKGVLSALIFYSLPLIGHFSFADMKIDNAVFFAASLATYVAFVAFFRSENTDEQSVPWWKSQHMRMLFLAGMFAGLAFGFKVTSVMVTLSILVLIVGVNLGWIGAVAGVFLAFAAMAKGGGLNIARITEKLTGVGSTLSPAMFSIIMFLCAAGCIAYAYRVVGRVAFLRMLKGLGMFVGGILVVMAPWLTYNNIANGNTVPSLSMSAPDKVSPAFLFVPPEGPVQPYMNVLPADLRLDPENPACKSTSMKEELDRYWGDSKGLGHYLLLPWRSVMNIDTGGYYVTTIPALLLFPLLLLVPFFWKPEGKWLRYLWLTTGFVVFQWMFLANGVPWYGVGMFLGLTLLLEALLVYSPSRPVRIAMGTLIGLSLVLAFGMRLWQYEMQQNLLEYPMGKINGKALEMRTIPYYNDIATLAVSRHNTLTKQPYVYRVGTFIPYFVPKNLEILGVADHQLDFFNCLNQERNPQLTMKRLIAFGFNSVIFDTNTATIERDPNGTLHKKVDAFVNFLNTPGLGTSILVNDVNAGIAFILLPPAL